MIAFQSFEGNPNDSIDVDDLNHQVTDHLVLSFYTDLIWFIFANYYHLFIYFNDKMRTSAGYYPSEIPIVVVPSSPITCLSPTLQKIVSVQEILFTEERQEFLSFTQRSPPSSSSSLSLSSSLSSSPSSSRPHPLAVLHAEGVYQKALCRLLENGCAPVHADMEQRVKALQEKVK